MSNYFYRFRSTEALLGKYKELDKQEIYFASPDELNDPLEGYKKVTWQGNKVLWTNFFRHYAICFIKAHAILSRQKKNFDIKSFENIVYLTKQDFNEEKYQKASDIFSTLIIEINVVKDFIEKFSIENRNISFPEINLYLKVMSPIFIVKAFEILKSFNIKTNLEFSNEVGYASEFFYQLINFRPSDEQKLEDIIKSCNRDLISMYLKQDLDFYKLIGEKIKQKRGAFFILREFSEFYLEKLKKLVFPQWYTSCFVKNPDNSAMWGVYGDSHRGVCLKFKSDFHEKYSINLQKKQLINGKNEDVDDEFSFHKINYQKDCVKINFFEAIQYLLPKEKIDFWYGDSKNSSIIREHISEEDKISFWNNHGISTVTKLPHWQHEQEYRLILSLSEKKTDRLFQKLRYHFLDLQGIIFGIKTSYADKLEIINIILPKIKEYHHKNLLFFQAEYDDSCQEIKYLPIHDLNSRLYLESI